MISHPLVALTPRQQSAAHSGLLLTASERLSREYTSAYHTALAANARPRAWQAPRITSLTTLAKQRYEHARYTGQLQAKLLSSHHQHLVFRQCAPANTAHLVSLFETAWEQLHAYRLNTADPAFGATENGECFRAWAQQVKRTLAKHNWLTQVQLLDQPALWEGFSTACDPASLLYRVGFDVLTTQQVEWFEQLTKLGVTVEFDDESPPAMPAPTTTVAFANDTQELTHAISWACELLDSTATGNPPPRIGIVVPELNRHYARVRRLLRTKLDPEQHRAQGLFNIGGGIALNQQPAVASALQLFASIAAPLPHNAIAQLLKNPYFPRLQTHKPLPPSAGTQLRLTDVPQDLRSAELREVVQRIGQWPKEQPLADWCREAQTILLHTGWHQARSDSAGFQAVERFLELMRLEDIDGPTRSLTWRTAQAELTSLTGRALFAEATRDAPIQVLGYLEAIELHFDHLWIVGMSDSAWPAQVSANPFLPPAVLRAASVPRSTHDAELAFAQRWLNKVTHNAPDIVISYVSDSDELDLSALPQNDAGEPILPGLTPLLTHTDYRPAPLGLNTDYHPFMAPGAFPVNATQHWHDDHGTPPAAGALRGGTGRFENQAQCPFRAWAIHELGLRSETPAHSLPNAMEQGNLIHRALDVLFEQLPSKTALVEVEADALAGLCHDAAMTAAAKTIARYPAAVRAAEVERAQSLLLNFLDFESGRADFTVVAREQKTTVAVGPYEITVQLDRVDLTQQGRVVLDYKTGSVQTKGLRDERLTAPQLPLYVAAQAAQHTAELEQADASQTQQLAGAFYAQLPINQPELRHRIPYKGVAHEDPLDSPKSLVQQDAQWLDQCRLWTDQLTQLAEEIAAGLAGVTPQPGACRYCHLQRLCRIELTTD